MGSEGSVTQSSQSMSSFNHLLNTGWRREWLPTWLCSPGEFHGEEPGGLQFLGLKELGTTEQLTLSLSLPNIHWRVQRQDSFLKPPSRGVGGVLRLKAGFWELRRSRSGERHEEGGGERKVWEEKFKLHGIVWGLGVNQTERDLCTLMLANSIVKEGWDGQ